MYNLACLLQHQVNLPGQTALQQHAPVVHKDPVGVDLGHSIGRAGMERCGLTLRHLMHLSKHLRGGCLVDAALVSQASTTDSLEQVQSSLSCTQHASTQLVNNCQSHPLWLSTGACRTAQDYAISSHFFAAKADAPKTHHAGGSCCVLGQLKGHLDMTLSSQVVDLVWLRGPAGNGNCEVSGILFGRAMPCCVCLAC